MQTSNAGSIGFRTKKCPVCHFRILADSLGILQNHNNQKKQICQGSGKKAKK